MNNKKFRNGLSGQRWLLCTLASGLLTLAVPPAIASSTPGTVVSWGRQIIPYNEPGTRYTRIAAGGEHSLALRSDGTVVAWGSDIDGQSAVPVGLIDVVAIVAGQSHSLALKSDGTIVAWGENEHGQIRVPAGLNRVVAIAAGNDHSLAIVQDIRLIPPVFERIRALSDGTVELDFVTRAGQAYLIRTSSDLTTWTTMTNLTATHSSATFHDTNLSGVRKRFYRIAIP
jgi:alpha-tubulin suppressor-like RCC1 family protein